MFPHTLTDFLVARLYPSLMIGLGMIAIFASYALAQMNLLADGVYLYGQSPQPDEIGQEYLVFQVKGSKISGAIYYPSSEFNCFSGAIVANQMSLGIIDPNDRQVYPYSIALVSPSPVASEQVPSEVNLAGYHRLANLSPNDQRILKVCVNN